MARSDARTMTGPETPTMPVSASTEPLNIVILGASFAGLSCAHHFLDYTVHRLRVIDNAPNYCLVIVSPSTHIYWNIGAPRALVAPGLIKHEDLFIPIQSGFDRHRGHNFCIVQGEAIALDPSSHTVTVQLLGSTGLTIQRSPESRKSRQSTSGNGGSCKTQKLRYHALIMATGSSAHSELLSLHGPHQITVAALRDFHRRVAMADSIIIGGGGTSGVETAGQLATYLNHSRTYPFKRLEPSPKEITLITSDSRCLPMLPPKVGRRAEKMLRRLGVEIIHDALVVGVKEGYPLPDHQTEVHLSDRRRLLADIYIPCTGVEPNSAYAPATMKDPQGYIVTDPGTLRVTLAAVAGATTTGTSAPARLYAVGDVAAYSQNYVLDVYGAVPAVMHNLLNDLLAHEYALASPYGGNQERIDGLRDEHYRAPPVDSQVCPISRFGGVGLLLGRTVPSFAVYMSKGRDYRVRMARKVVVDGGSPYAIRRTLK